MVNPDELFALRNRLAQLRARNAWGEPLEAREMDELESIASQLDPAPLCEGVRVRLPEGE